METQFIVNISCTQSIITFSALTFSACAINLVTVTVTQEIAYISYMHTRIHTPHLMMNMDNHMYIQVSENSTQHTHSKKQIIIIAFLLLLLTYVTACTVHT